MVNLTLEEQEKLKKALARMETPSEWRVCDGFDLFLNRQTWKLTKEQVAYEIEVLESVHAFDWVILEVLADMTCAEINSLYYFAMHLRKRKGLNVPEDKQTFLRRLQHMEKLYLISGKEHKESKQSDRTPFGGKPSTIYCVTNEGIEYLKAKREYKGYFPSKLPAWSSVQQFRCVCANYAAAVLHGALANPNAILHGTHYRYISGRGNVLYYANIEIPATDTEPRKMIVFEPIFSRYNWALFTRESIKEKYDRRGGEVAAILSELGVPKKRDIDKAIEKQKAMRKDEFVELVLEEQKARMEEENAERMAGTSFEDEPAPEYEYQQAEITVVVLFDGIEGGRDRMAAAMKWGRELQKSGYNWDIVYSTEAAIRASRYRNDAFVRTIDGDDGFEVIPAGDVFELKDVVQ